MQKIQDPRKKAPEFDFRELKNSSTDGVTYRISTGEIVLWHVFSEICDEWFSIPLDLVQKTFPNRFEAAVAEIQEIVSLESKFEAKIDHDIDQSLDDKAVS